MIHWSNELKRLRQAQREQDGFTVFRNCERLDIGGDPDTNTTFYKEFRSPFYRIPAMVITDTGRIIVGADYRSKPNDQVAILPAVAYSDDNGKTWTKQVIDKTPTHQNANYRIMDQTMFYFKGVIHIICGKWNGTANNVNWTQTLNDPTWSVVHYYSNDNGNTWIKEDNFQTKVTEIPAQASWLGAVGNCIETRNGTIVVPVQFAPQAGVVKLTLMYSNDGVNWNRSGHYYGNNLSETSLAQIINSSGDSEILCISRRDPNTPNNKAGTYVVQRSNGSWDNNNFREFGTYNGKIPARGSSGCQGSAISNHIGKTKYGNDQTIMVSYAENFLNNISGYTRDNIVVGIFKKTNDDNNSIVLRELERIDLGAGAFVDGVPYGGYSILYFNPNCLKLGIAYEHMGGIKYKDLSQHIPALTGYTLG